MPVKEEGLIEAGVPEGVDSVLQWLEGGFAVAATNTANERRVTEWA
jgi:hypothetical protein